MARVRRAAGDNHVDARRSRPNCVSAIPRAGYSSWGGSGVGAGATARKCADASDVPISNHASHASATPPMLRFVGEIRRIIVEAYGGIPMPWQLMRDHTTHHLWTGRRIATGSLGACMLLETAGAPPSASAPSPHGASPHHTVVAADRDRRAFVVPPRRDRVARERDVDRAVVVPRVDVRVVAGRHPGGLNATADPKAAARAARRRALPVVPRLLPLRLWLRVLAVAASGGRRTVVVAGQSRVRRWCFVPARLDQRHRRRRQLPQPCP